MNVTIDDASPLFQFYSASNNNSWITDHANGAPYPDAMTDDYYDDTFHGSFSENDHVSLRFNGSAIYLYGAKRPNHGQFSVSVDGGQAVTFNGYSAQNEFQQLLFNQTGLSTNQEHTVVLTAQPDQTHIPSVTNPQWWVDVDYAIVTVNATQKVYTTKIDDQSSLFTFAGGSWGGGPINPQTYYNSTAHITNDVGAYATLNFNGSGIGIYGGLYKDHGNYSITLDGVNAGTYNGTWFEIQPQEPLFIADNLNDSAHTIMITNVGHGPLGTFLDIDYAVVNSTIAAMTLPGSSTGNATQTTTPSSSASNSGSSVSAGSNSDNSGASTSHHSHAGAIAGGVVGGVIGLVLILLAIWFFFLRSKRRNGRRGSMLGAKKVNLSGEDPDSPTPFMVTNPHSQPGSMSTNFATSTGNRISPESLDRPFFSTLPPPPASNAASYPQSDYPRSENPPSTVNLVDGVEDNASRGTSNRLGSSYSPAVQQYADGGSAPSTAPSILSGETIRPRTATATSTAPKALGVALPYTSTSPTSPRPQSGEISPSSPLSGRMQVPGRETDIGPLPDHHHQPALPPDYRQATQPLPGQVSPEGRISHDSAV